MKSPIESYIGGIFIPVSNIENAMKWYCDILSRPVGEIIYGHLFVIPLKPGHSLILDERIYSPEVIKDVPLFHFNTSDIQGSYDYLKDKGVPIVTEIQHNKWFSFSDPDGNVLMVCQT
ncbi:VOC family protein [Bacillus alkalicellulosilyticus]|uniref:VOC family protein n=1 Tax=Alkalihalobacterium alkalicellulosilyticum TaxID=1912214 RepID=UPI000997515E|nr:VOC family protein [Bacillus alkalicellulosilyticus]